MFYNRGEVLSDQFDHFKLILSKREARIQCRLGFVRPQHLSRNLGGHAGPSMYLVSSPSIGNIIVPQELQ